MNRIPLGELKAFRQIETNFDAAFVSLLTKLEQLNNQEEPECEESSEENQQAGDDVEDKSSLEECSESSEESSDEDHSHDGNSERSGRNVLEESQTKLLQRELVSLALCFAKLMTKSLLAVERAANLEAQVCELQRENCTLRAIASNMHQVCMSTNKKGQEESPKRKSQVQVNLLTSKGAIEQEIDSLIESQTMKVQNLERKYKNHIFGLTLAVDYLKKELSGRVQQLQIYDQLLTQKELDQAKIAKLERIWNQLVCEITLNRHKTIVRLGEATYQEGQQNSDLSPNQESELDNLCSLLITGCQLTAPKLVDFANLGQLRFVTIYIEKNKRIGLRLAGGSEKHMPLYIQRVETDSVAGRNGQFRPGDIILSIQSFDMVGTTQEYAVQLLKSMSGWCRLGVVRIPVTDVATHLDNQHNFELLYHDFADTAEEDQIESDSSANESDSSSHSKL